jgi:hypothetical protein
MDRRIKIGLTIFGSLAVAGGIGYLIYRQVKKSKKQQSEIEAKEQKEKENIQTIQQNEQQLQSQKEGSKVTAVRNIDKGINNAFGDIRGVKLYPARKSNDPSQGHPFALGYVNVREDAEVNNAQGIRDLWKDNMLGKVEGGGQLIGTIVAEKYDDLTPKMRWFRVKLDSKLKSKFGKQYGWVRSDAVTFRSFTKKSSSNKKSSFDGNMIERYNTSYQLGAEVFPHSGWNLYSNVVDADLFQNFDANQLDINL